MARFHGVVGYGESVEDPPGTGNWKDVITEFTYTGDVLRNVRNLEARDEVNDDIDISNSISIIADEYAVEHFSKIKYVGWMGLLWKVPSVEVRRPRLILTVGGVYNGPTPTTP